MSYNKRPNLGQVAMAASEPVVIASDQSSIPVTVAGVATAAAQATLLTELQLKADLTETQPVSAASLPLPAGAATAAAQATLLTELQLKADLTETQPVSLASVPSHAVTNAGTFAVQDSEKIADNGAFTDGTTKVQPVGHIFDEVAGTALTENDIAASRIDSKRAQIGVIEDATTRGQRAAVSAAGALKIDGSAVTQPVSAALLPLPTGAATSALQTQPGVDIGDVTVNNAAGASAVNIQDGGNSITVDGTVAISGSVAVTGPLTDTQLRATAVPVTLTSTTITGTVAATQSGTWTVQPGNTANTTPWLVNQTPRTTGGATPSVTISAATTNATSLKASAGTVFGIQVFNTNAAARYLKLYNKASAPTVGTDTPVKVITIPGNTAGAGAVVSLPDHGVAFGTGIAWALTTGAAHTDTGAVALSEIIVNIDYV